MIPDWQTNSICFSEKLITRFPKSYLPLERELNNIGQNLMILPKTNDIWARDYMPIQINENTFIEYRFDPDYLQGWYKGFRDLKSYPDLVCDAIGLKTVKSDIIMDGGNVIKSSNCVIMTEKVVKENRLSYLKNELIKKLEETFEVEKIVLIPWDKLEQFGHADGMVRFIDDNNVLVNHYYHNDSILINRLKKAGLNPEFLKYDVKKEDKRSWAYLNFLQTKDLILLPKFGIDEDDQAFEQIEYYFSEYSGRIAQVDISEIVKEGGGLNCISWTLNNSFNV